MSLQFVEKNTEQAIKTLLTTAGALSYGSNNDTAAFRGFWLDDEPDDEKEEVRFPFVAIAAGPNFNYEGRSQTPMRQLNAIMMIATHITDDPKRADMGEIYSKVRHALETGTLAIADATFNNLEIMESTPPMTDGNANMVEMMLTIDVCVVYASEEEGE